MTIRWTEEEFEFIGNRVKSDMSDDPISRKIINAQKSLPRDRQRPTDSIYASHIALGKRVLAAASKVEKIETKPKDIVKPTPPVVIQPVEDDLHTMLANTLSQLVARFAPKATEIVEVPKIVEKLVFVDKPHVNFTLSDIRNVIREEIRLALNQPTKIAPPAPLQVQAVPERTSLLRADVLGYTQPEHQRTILDHPIAQHFKLRFLSPEEGKVATTFSPTVFVVKKWCSHTVVDKAVNGGYEVIRCEGVTHGVINAMQKYYSEKSSKTSA